MKPEQVLKKLGNGWEKDGDSYRYNCDETVLVRVRREEKGWTAVRFEIRDGKECGTNGQYFPSLKQLVKHLNS